MRATEQLWRTADGDRLVPDGDLDAAFLAYNPGDEIAAGDEAKVPGAKAAPKARAKPADKAKAKPANKGSAAKPETEGEDS